MDNPPVFKRPKSSDNEEELFRMQEEFLRTRQQPSAKVINLRASNKTESTSLTPLKYPEKSERVKSKFAEMKRMRTQERMSTSQSGGEMVNPTLQDKVNDNFNKPLEDAVNNLPQFSSPIILGNIVEKKYNAHMYEFKPIEKLCTETGFPKVFISNHMKNSDNKSLFWQQISQEECSDNKMDISQVEKAASSSFENEKSNIIEGLWAEEIHKENLEKLNQMSKEDILEEKKKLEASLSPDLLKFLKERKNKKEKDKENKGKTVRFLHENKIIMNEVPEKTEHTKQDDKDTPMDVDENKEIIPQPPREIMEQAKQKGWIHMDSLEPEKLKWMENLPSTSKDQPASDEPYNARFDFNGMLLPYKDESIPIEKGLHHHGEEPERPGYSLQELLQLSRSSAQQQRCTALTTLANVLEKSRKGWYDKVLQPAPLIALHERNILLLLRFSLDDTSIAIVTATLQALRAFLYSEADEVCLDRLYGFNIYTEPVLAAPKNDVTDIDNLKDHELVQLDAIAGLLRTDIILRIRYILSELRPSPIGVTCALEILIRLARYSNSTALNIASTPNLLDTIVENFMPLSTDQLAMYDIHNNVHGIPVPTAVRLCRILTVYGGRPVAERLDRLKIVQRIISYTSSDTGKHGANLSIESLRLWKILLMKGIAMDSISGAQLILISQIQLLLSNHDLSSASELSCEYAAALIAVAGYQPSLKTNITVLLSKWNTQLQYLSTPTWGTTKLIAETLLAIDDPSVTQLLTISTTKVFSNLDSTSNLLSDCETDTGREPASLPNLGVLTQEGSLQSIVSQHSCMPFLAIVLNTYVNYKCLSELQAILKLPALTKYLKRIQAWDWCLERSWYSRSELFFLTALVHAASMVKDQINKKTVHILWKIALKLVSALPADMSSVVKNMLRAALAQEKINYEIVVNGLDQLSVNTGISNIQSYLNHDVAALYEKYVSTNGEWDQAAMPKDWLYLPLVHIYGKCKNSDSCNVDDKKNILTLLSLQLILPDLVEELSQSLRFSRLVLVYLCDTVYLSEDVSGLLTTVMSTLLKNYHKTLNFTADLPGLSSFTDLFTAMCEHFCSTSYGDFGFSMVLLAPIAQRHDVHYRKLLWSEHAGLLRYLRLPIDKLVIPLKEYLYPNEEDASLIESYITALVRGLVKQEWCPIPYTIAVHHSAMYLKLPNKLAVRMRARMEKIPDRTIANTLLYYEPPQL